MCLKGSLIAIEDGGAIFTQREGGEERLSVSFSGLVNAIDGVAAQEGRALVKTTNHKEKLDSAQIQPGRADVHTELGLVSAAKSCRLFARVFPGENDLALFFAQKLGDQRFSPVQIQSWLLDNSADPKRAAPGWGFESQTQDVAAE